MTYVQKPTLATNLLVSQFRNHRDDRSSQEEKRTWRVAAIATSSFNKSDSLFLSRSRRIVQVSLSSLPRAIAIIAATECGQ